MSRTSERAARAGHPNLPDLSEGFALGDPPMMALFAVCSRLECGYVHDKNGTDSRGDGAPTLSSLDCPQCGSPLLARCSFCFTAITQLPTWHQPFCSHCGRRLIFSA